MASRHNQFAPSAPESITLTVLRNPLDTRCWARDTMTVESGALAPLQTVLPTYCAPDGSWVVIENGRLIPADEWSLRCTTPGAELIIYPVLHGAVAQIITGVVLMAAGAGLFFVTGGAAAPWGIGLMLMGAGMIVGGSATLIIGSPSMPQIAAFGGAGAESSSPTFGFQGIRNSTQVGSPIGVVYGTHKVGGQYIQMFTRNDNDTSVLYALLALSEGEITAISDILINGQAITNYTGVTTDQVMGTSNQSAIALFGDKTTSAYTNDAAIVDTTWLTYTTVGTAITAFELLVEFQQGLFTIGSGGNLSTAAVTLTVEYKLSSASSWTTMSAVTYTEAKRAVLRRTIREEGLAAGQYDIRVQRTTVESTSLTVVDAVRRASINEIINDAFIYPHTALLAVKAVATNQLSGGVPTITSVVQGVKVKVFTSATAYTKAHSNNPAWVVFDMLTNRRYGMGKFLYMIEHTGSWTFTNGSTTVTGSGFTNAIRKGQKIDVTLTSSTGSIYTVSSYTNATTFVLTTAFTGTTGSYTAAAHRDDLDVASFVSWASFCDTLVSDGNASTEKRATCDFVFDADRTSAWDAVIKICGLGFAAPIKIGNYIRIKFQQAEAAAQLFTMANIVKDSFGETFMSLKERANYFEVQYLNASNNYEQDLVTLEDPLLYTNEEPERKQTVSVYGCTRTGHAIRLARFYQLANRLITRTVAFSALIDAITCEPGDVINFQHDVPGWGQASRAASGSGSSTIVLDMPVTIGTGTYQVMIRHQNDTLETKTITSTAGTYTTLTISGTWTTIPADGEVVAVGVTAILVKPFRIIAIERQTDFTAKISAIEYSADLYDETNLTSVNRVNYSTLQALIGPVPAVTELTMFQLDSVINSVWVSFKPPNSLNYGTTQIWRTINNTDYLLGESHDGAFAIEGLPQGTVVTVKAITVSVTGVLGDLDTAPTASALITAGTPGDVTGLSWYFLDGHARLFWTAVTWVREITYELRLGTSWNTGIVLGNTAYTTTDAAGNGTYWIAAYDPINDAYSANPASLVLDIFRMNTGDTLVENVVAELDEDATYWSGTLSGGAVLDTLNNTISLTGAGFFDSIANMDLEDSIDFFGSIVSSGYYEIPSASIIDLTVVKPAHVQCTYTAVGASPGDTWDEMADVDVDADIDGQYASFVQCEIEINTAQLDGVFTGYRKFVPGLHVFRKMKLRAALSSSDTAVTCTLSAMQWTVDMPDRDEQQGNIALLAAGASYTFTPAFGAIPAIAVTIQDGGTGDFVALTSKSTTGFTLQVKNSSGAGVARTVDWHARGY